MTDEEIYKENVEPWYGILNVVAGCVGYFMIGQTVKAIVFLILMFIPMVNLIAWVLAIIDGWKLSTYMAEKKKPIGPWTFFWQLEE